MGPGCGGKIAGLAVYGEVPQERKGDGLLGIAGKELFLEPQQLSSFPRQSLFQ